MTIGIQQLLWQNERIRDTFHEAVHGAGDVDAALAVTATDCALLNVPVGTGATGQDLRRYLAEDVVPHRPSGLEFRRVSRTVDKFRVVEESVVAFVHDRELPWLLPGVAPTGRAVEVLAVSVVTVRLSRITSHRTLWDHSGLLARLTG